MINKTTISVLSLVLVTSFFIIQFVRQPATAKSKYSVVLATKRALSSTILATGTVRPKVGAEVKVGSRISGLLEQLYVTVGTQVKKGMVIAELDRSELLARNRLAEAELIEAEATLAFGEKAFARADTLMRKNLISVEAFEQAKMEFRIGQARQKRAAANIELNEVQLSYTIIRAPISGVVTSISTQKGEAISAGFSAPTFVTIADLEQLETVAFVDEVDIGRVSAGQEVTFVVDSYPSHDFQGVVRSIAPMGIIIANVVNYEVSIDIANPLDLLKPSMTANIIIVTDRQEVLTVPNEAIRRRNGQKFVALMEADNPVYRAITTGRQNDRYYEVVAGLKDGDKVILGVLEEIFN